MLNGQAKMVSNEVNHQSSGTAIAQNTGCSTTSNPTSSGSEPQASPQGQNASRSSQDDAMVSYVFQRQNDSQEYPSYPKSSRWFAPDETTLIDVRFLFPYRLD